MDAYPITKSRRRGSRDVKDVAQFIMEGATFKCLELWVGEKAIEKAVAKQQSQNMGQQLSLLDMVNTHLANQSTPLEAVKTVIQTIHPITYVSYSQLQTFESCPLHYKLLTS